MSSDLPLVLYGYPGSPYANRIAWYLHLRGIPFKTCEQPFVLPRPDVARLGINYRRIPILSIGRDVYLDTRLILAKLETFGSGPPLGAAAPDHAALQRLLSFYAVSGGVFSWAITLIPATNFLYTDPVVSKDRENFVPGGKFVVPLPAVRAEAVSNLQGYVGLLEDTLLADGRDWLLGGAAPGLADIEAVWPLHWLRMIPGTLVPEEGLGSEQFPKVWEWVERFDAAVNRAAERAGGQTMVKGDEAARIIVGSGYFEEAGTVAQREPAAHLLGLKQGDGVVVFPTDSGMTHKDSGSLVSVDTKEIVWETKTELEDSPTIRVHAPRQGFWIERENPSHL